LTAAARRTLAPAMPWLPDVLTNFFPGLGRVTTSLPNGRKLRLISDGEAGKDYIARKVAGRRLEEFEPETMRVFLSLLSDSATFLDVGANTGIFALAAAALDPRRRVYAFEPVPQIAARLSEHVRLNDLRNLVVELCAVSDSEGTVPLYVPATTSSLPTSASMQPGFKEQTERVMVPAVTLDTYVTRQRTGPIDLLKIDTETTESRVLAGAAELVRRDEPAIICELLCGPGEEALRQVLERQFAPRGYRFFWITGEGLVETPAPRGDRHLQFNNFLFISPKRLEHVAHLIVGGAARRYHHSSGYR
jgi:FkbM family methyltransferase